MLKKYLTVLSITTLAAALSACGGGNEPAGSTTVPSTSTSPTAVAGTNAPKPEFKALLQYARFDPNAEVVAKFLNEKTGYKVTYDMLPVENPDDKLNLLMANKEQYAFMLLTGPQYSKLASSGALEPIDELVNKYGTNMKNVISQNSWNGAKLNGKIYGIPQTGSGTVVNSSLIVRQDWMDELGLKPPTTRDELYTVMKTIKEKKNVMAISGGKSPLLPEILPTFGLTMVQSTLTTGWQDQNGKLVNAVENPNMKSYLTFMKKLYSEKLIDQEWSLNQANKVIENFTSGKAAIISNGYFNAPTVQNALLKNTPNAKIAALPYLKGDNGKVQVMATAGISYYVGIPKWADKKEEIVKYLDLKLDKEIHKEATIGKEGVHHKVENGNYFPILPIFNDQYNNASSFLTGVDEKNYPIYWQARVRKDPILTDAFNRNQEAAKGSTVVDPLSFAPPLEAIGKNNQKLQKLMEDTYLKYITGAEPLENYDKFLAQWKAEGGDDMTKAANEWYAANKK
ncbi:sugar ABC transporter substrate-binding protein [Paenibacillus marchantiophytorum]|uniref:Sugar ABC transporter substrate-binding protein n=1 Tax=Paenibacillus marchantiophytorum TaxID=1619310 RepID=A0ABQ2BSQ7_9BACL|nr:extracellular solute-binding protein [Paenibacillus marchantiophytorum]GGI45193.1 sugar ABC transporter substrate-binding protein [Paenibacillus marchantiophytorum]